jgi:hypothetical protein
MNHKPTSKLFRHLLASAVIAVATLALPRTASAGASDPIAYWLGGGGADAKAAIAAGNLLLKQTGATARDADFQQDLLEATQKALFSTDANYITSGLPQKATASALAIYMMKRLPAYAPQIAKWATQAALTDPGTGAPLKYSSIDSRTKDAQKVADQAMAIGLKTYPSGTQNSTFSGLTVIKLAPGATAISSQVVQGAIDSTGGLGSDNATIRNLSYSLVKAAAKSVKTNPLTVGSTVVALSAQYAGTAQNMINATVQGILLGSTQGAKKYINDIAQGAGYALFAVYQETGGTYAESGKSVAETYFDANKATVYASMLNAGLKPSVGLQEQIYNAFLTGVGTAQAQLVTLGAQALSTDGFFAYNNGTGTPVTNVQDL